MASNLRVVPQSMPQPSQQDWVWDGANWNWCGCPPTPCPPTPPPCPPSGFPTPCPPWFPPPAGQAPWYPGANGGVSFSATPPVNPIRGNFWWDGTMLHLFDGAAWVDIGPGASGAPGSGGAFVGTSPPANPAQGALWWNGTVLQVWDGTSWQVSQGTMLEFAIMQPSPATVGVDSTHWTAVPLTATPFIDVQSAWNPATLRYTPKVAGYYQFQGRSLNGGAASAGLAIVKNDPGSYSSLSTDITVTLASANAAATMSVVGITQMNGTSDYVRLWAYNASGSLLAAGSNNVLAAYKLP